jgi:mannose-1-phosphate guanylyltransferase/mannose-6-phosphate isomerase
MKVIILAGGSGNRLWPLSREEKPKQFLLLNDSSSLLQKTIKRLLTFVKTEDLLIVTNKKYHDLVIDQLDIIDKKLSSRILIEKEKKNTAPSIILAIKYFIEIEKTSLDEAILVSPCDHYISSEDLFQKSIEIACEIKNPKKIIVFGAIPTRPETGYGYIEKEEGQVDKNIFDVRRFVEKPSLDLAQKYYANKNYLWNCGFFLFSICSFIKEIKEHSEELSPFLSFSYQKIQSEFSSFINISIDYALIEKTKNLQVVPLLCDWSDMGSWDNIYEMFPKD